jgi:hypothetical protein
MTEIVAERLSASSAIQIPEHALPQESMGPKRIGKSSEWSCKIEVQGLAVPFEMSVVGVDSFQALYLGLRLICAHLEKHEVSLSFLDGRPGDGALPLIAYCPPSSKAEAYRFIEGKIRDQLDSHE